MEIFEDLQAESEDLDALVAGLTPAQWALPTPAEGWTVAHQIAHLAWTDRQAALAATDPAAFTAALREATPDLVERGADPAAHPPGSLLETWRAGRAEVLKALRDVPPGGRMPWFGPSMAAPSMATARLMETWAHGQDIADALGVVRRPTDRLRHVAHIAVRARDYAFSVHGLPAPDQPFQVVLTSPSGDDPWSWGPTTAAQRVTGPALDFCLLAVRRRNRADLTLAAMGEDASRWLDVIQAFAGPPGSGRPPSGKPSGRPSGKAPSASSTH